MRHLFSLISQTIPKGSGILVKFFVDRIFEACLPIIFFFPAELLAMRTYGKENFFQLKTRCAMHGLGDLLSGRTFKFQFVYTLPRRTVAPLSQLSLGHVYVKKKERGAFETERHCCIWLRR